MRIERKQVTHKLAKGKAGKKNCVYKIGFPFVFHVFLLACVCIMGACVHRCLQLHVCVLWLYVHADVFNCMCVHYGCMGMQMSSIALPLVLI